MYFRSDPQMAGLYYVLLDPHYFENNFFQNSIHLNVHEVLCSDFWHLCGIKALPAPSSRAVTIPS